MRGQAQAAVEQQRVAVDAAGGAGVLQGLLQQREEGGGARGHVRPVDGWGGTSRQGLGLAVECVELGAISLRVGLLLRVAAVVAQPAFQFAAIVGAELGIARLKCSLRAATSTRARALARAWAMPCGDSLVRMTKLRGKPGVYLTTNGWSRAGIRMAFSSGHSEAVLVEHHVHVAALGGTQHPFVAPDVLLVERGAGSLGDDHRFTTLAHHVEEGGVRKWPRNMLSIASGNTTMA